MGIHEYMESTVYGMERLLLRRSVPSGIKRVVRGPRMLTVDLKLKNPDDYKKAMSIDVPLGIHVGSENVLTYIHRGVIRYEILLPESLWKTYSLTEFGDTTIGVASDKTRLGFGLERPNTLIIGESGSGKTNLAHAMLLQAMRKFDSEQLRIGLVDPHGGFGNYAGKAHLAGPPAQSHHEIADVFAWFREQLEERKELGEVGVRSANLPLLLLVADECSSGDVIGEGKSLNTQNLETLRMLVKEGRKFNMRVMMITQKPTEEDLPGILSIATTRYIGRVSKAVGNNLANADDAKPHMLTGKGDFFFTSPSQTTRFQAVMIKDSDYNNIPAGKYQNWPVSSRDWEDDYIPTNGRPRTELEPDIVAAYMQRDISRREAREVYDVGQTVHLRYREFAKRLVEVLNYERE